MVYHALFPLHDTVFLTELDPCVGALPILGYLAFPGRSCGSVLPDLLPLPLPAEGGAVVSAVLLSVVEVNARSPRLFS
jgi:hypothetical protein